MNIRTMRILTVLICAAILQQSVFADSDSNALYQQALTLENKGDLSQAQTIYGQIISQYPTSRAALLDRAAFRAKLTQCKQSLENGDIATARSYADQIKKMGGTTSQAAARLYNAAAAFEAAKFYDDALSLYQQTVAQEPAGKYAGMDYAGLQIMLIQCKRAVENGDSNSARTFINQYINQTKALDGSESQMAKYLYNAGFAFETAHLYDDALSYYQQIISQYPASSVASADCAGFHIKLTQCKQALKNYDTASARTYADKIKTLGSSPSQAPSQLYALANEFAAAQYYDKMLSNDAIALYQQLITQYPNSIYAGADFAGWRLKLAQCKLSLKVGDVVAANTSADQIKALSGSPSKKAERLYNIGFAFDEVHALDDAAGFYRQAIAACPNDQALISQATFTLRCVEREIALMSPTATVDSVNGMMTDFASNFGNGCSISNAAHAIGKCLYSVGSKGNDNDPNTLMRLKKAEAVYAYWDSQHSDNDKWLTGMRKGWIYYYHGLCLNKLGNYAKAAEAFEKAFKSNPNHQYAAYLLYAQGKCYEKLLARKLVSEAQAKATITAKYSELITKYPQSWYVKLAKSWLSGN